MKNTFLYIVIISMTSFFIGMIFYCYQKDWIILRFPKNYILDQNDLNQKIEKKSIKLFYWKNPKFIQENSEVVLSDDLVENIFKIIVQWINLIEEEGIINKKINIQGTFLLENELFISFDSNLFNLEWSTYEKLMLIESFLKTLRDNEINIKNVRFLINHQEMSDSHLDFSHAWPISGFKN